MNIFEYAARNKLRFSSSRGNLTVEDLWDVPLRSKDEFNLNSVAKVVNKALKDATEESFVDTGRKNVRLETAFEVVKHVIDVKLAEEEAMKKRAENQAKKQVLLKALAEKQEGKLSALSEKELLRQIEALD